ncbi:alpha/beta hydrolase [Pseudarthrobacter enclensis]|uniref:Acetyl esterase/lipase n=1 Tax=Pseudarthrobacter enclensis TaxID=993070 RepID=A0ABT9RUZ5_9MICC|nr:alpha/beta hydrolase [Pseudarthrobacter enclensis]MDP9888039.1 acetyl esterase/lipase [Pseudarthrobacter enclensis]
MTTPRGLSAIPACPEAGGPRPAILVLPGGGYARQADHEAEPVADWLAGLGIHAFVLRYRVAPDRHPAPLEDAKEAMLYIRSGQHGLAVDSGRAGVLGFSAGGHLAATLSTAAATGNPSLDVPAAVPDLSVLCYPVASMTSQAHQGSVQNLLGDAPPSDLLTALSAELNVTPLTPPAFLWHTADDAAVPVSNSLNYARALFAAGVPAELHVFPHGRHGLGLATGEPGPQQWTSLCAAWLQRAGWTHTAAASAASPVRG